jgi:hypothetical protein
MFIIILLVSYLLYHSVIFCFATYVPGTVFCSVFLMLCTFYWQDGRQAARTPPLLCIVIPPPL